MLDSAKTTFKKYYFPKHNLTKMVALTTNFKMS